MSWFDTSHGRNISGVNFIKCLMLYWYLNANFGNENTKIILSTSNCIFSFQGESTIFDKGNFLYHTCSELCYFSGLKSDILGTQSPKCLRQKGFQTSSSFVYMIAKSLYILQSFCFMIQNKS